MADTYAKGPGSTWSGYDTGLDDVQQWYLNNYGVTIPAGLTTDQASYWYWNQYNTDTSSSGLLGPVADDYTSLLNSSLGSTDNLWQYQYNNANTGAVAANTSNQSQYYGADVGANANPNPDDYGDVLGLDNLGSVIGTVAHGLSMAFDPDYGFHSVSEAIQSAFAENDVDTSNVSQNPMDASFSGFGTTGSGLTGNDPMGFSGPAGDTGDTSGGNDPGGFGGPGND